MSQTVDRALSILPLLAEGPPTSDGSPTRLDVHKSTALRLLRTLHEHGFVYRQSDQRYRLGARPSPSPRRRWRTSTSAEIAHPTSRTPQRAGRAHAVHLAVYEEDEVVLASTRSRAACPVRMYSRIGKPVAITVARRGRNCCWPTCPENERRGRGRAARLPHVHGPFDHRTPAAFLAGLAKVREQGWATDLGGHEESINCVAAAHPAAPTAGWSPPCRSPRAQRGVCHLFAERTPLPPSRWCSSPTGTAISGEYSGQKPRAPGSPGAKGPSKEVPA